MNPKAPPAGKWLVDGHVHFHAGFSWQRFLDAALSNFSMAGHQMELTDPVPGCLMMTESAGVNAFRRLRDTPASIAGTGWQVSSTDDRLSLVMRRERQETLLMIAGRQIVSGEGLEVLALGCEEEFPDGAPIHQVLDDVRARDAVPVLPWGVGKWTGRRGRIIREIIEAGDTGRVLLGDSGNRLSGAPRPALLDHAERSGFLIVPGSDPLPLSSHVTRAGSCGFVLESVRETTRPAETIRAALRSMSGPVTDFGIRASLARFTRDQFAMQWRKRFGGPAA